MTQVLKIKLPRGPNGEKDPNDYAKSGNFEALDEAIAQAEAEAANDGEAEDKAKDEPEDFAPPPRRALTATMQELLDAKLTPRCIVEDYLYADVAQIFAPGSVGKTTMLLYEAVNILTRPTIWGLRVVNPGWFLFVTKEDQRERLLARQLRIMRGMRLSDAEIEKVMSELIIWDVTGTGEKLIQDEGGNIRLTDLPGRIVQRYRDDPPAVVVFDPMVSFGCSEARVNDNEQGLIDAARFLVKYLDCCVRFIHHTGQASARSPDQDQYSGRGGTAMPDGTRMTCGLRKYKAPEPLPYGCQDGPEVSLFLLERHKVSYSKPNLPPIWIRRNGWEYDYFTVVARTSEAVADSQADQLERFLQSAVKNGELYSKNQLEAQSGRLSMSRAALRTALSKLQASARVVEAPLPKDRRQGGLKTFLCPSNLAAEFGEVDADERHAA
jgi:RecA-family ATPase